MQTGPIHRRSSDVQTMRGFTLLELLVALAVAAILLAIAVPAFQGVIRHNTMTVAVNSLVGSLNFARSEAVKRGQTVLLCKSADGSSCSTDGNWAQGWIVYVPQPGSTTVDTILRVHGSLDAAIDITGPDTMAFDASGFAQGPNGLANGTLKVKASHTDRVVKIVVSNPGRIRTETQS